MKLILAAAAIVASTTVQATELSREVVCDAWARNAMMGAVHASQGHRRELVPITVPQLRELLLHDKLSAIEGIPVLAEEYATDDGRKFLEESVFYGFDYMQQLPKSELLEFLANSTAIFTQACHLKFRAAEQIARVCLQVSPVSSLSCTAGKCTATGCNQNPATVGAAWLARVRGDHESYWGGLSIGQ